MTTKAGIDAWTDTKARAARISQDVGATPVETGPLADQATKLDIPGVAAHFSNSGGRNAFSLQTYNGFATEAKRRNAGVSFIKDLMDLAFHISTTRMSKHTDNTRRRDKQAMIDRVSSTSWMMTTMSLTVRNSVSARNLISIGKMTRDRDL